MAQQIRRRLGDILLEANKLSQDDLLRALSEQKKYGEKLGNIIVKLGFLSAKEILTTVSEQLHIPILNLDNKEIPEELLKLFPEELIKHYMILPVGRKFNVLNVAMVDPLDINAIDEVARTLKMEVEPCIVSEAEMNRAINKYYGSKTIVEETLETMHDGEDLTLIKDEDEDEVVSVNMTQEEPVVRFVNSLLAQGLNDGASDIHIEPQEKKMRVRMRIDGKLREIPSPDKKLFLPIISRVKILAGMDIAKTRIPQDGRFNIRDGSKNVGLRVSTFPTINGEKAVLRLLDKSVSVYGIEKLGFLPYDEEKIKDVIKKPYGFILSTGPTGSGKSTTLYAILNRLNSIEKNIITVEDPVEYTLDGISQAQTNPRAGLTFETGLRAILRQDPDIIMVGEIRDKETATMAVHSALTGHLVFSTLHTNDAPGAISRLVEMGVEPFLIASSVSCVIGQRLIRKICDECKTSYSPVQAIRDLLNIGPDAVLYKGSGCPVCKGTGYKGRTGVYEVLVMDDGIRELVLLKTSSDVIRKMAIEKGMVLMYDDAMEKVRLGQTTLEEGLNVTQVN